MKFLLVLLATVAVLDARPSLELRASVDAPFIINGEDADEGEWPWQMSLRRAGAHSCGAALFSENVALTAAHCVDGAVTNVLSVSAGQHQLNQDSSEYQVSDVTEYIMHEDYDQGTGSYPQDIAILILDSILDMSPETVQSIDMSDDSDGDWQDGDCWITGWGRYHQNASQELPNTLQKANIDVIDNDYCQELMTGVIGAQIIPSHICVYNNHNGACSGDSGGPLSCRNGDDDFKLAGLTSWGIVSVGQGCQVSYPSVYTRVSSFHDWVLETIP